MKRLALGTFIALLGIGGGVLTHAALDAIRNGTSLEGRIEGVWKVGKAFAFDARLNEWREELNPARLFYEFSGGKSCVQFRVTPHVSCLRYDPYLLQGNVLTLVRGSHDQIPVRYHLTPKKNQLELIQEENRERVWQPMRREVLVPFPLK